MRCLQRIHDTARWKTWSSILLLVLGGLAGGCSEGAKLIQATDRGGVVTYPYKEQVGSMTTRFRSEALHVMEDHCKGGYTIMKEGETKGRSRLVENQGIPEVISEYRWGIQFQCK
ncbi:MAG: hypothetical protein E8D45_04105 [Nitrospira sp.]|nr:MAG: hypothetical protein E8D45_04105 [Nitrospira sp.]